MQRHSKTPATPQQNACNATAKRLQHSKTPATQQNACNTAKRLQRHSKTPATPQQNACNALANVTAIYLKRHSKVGEVSFWLRKKLQTNQRTESHSSGADSKRKLNGALASKRVQ
jgi:hypothetical protein